jgi:glutathione S-transferase
LLRLHDYVLSADCYTARLMLGLLGAKYETVAVDMYPGRRHESEAFRQLSPDAVMPVLEDGDTVVAGAIPVLMHLATRHDPTETWLRKDGRGLVIAWLSFVSGELSVLEKARQAAAFEGPGDLSALRKAGWQALRVLDDRMADRHNDGSEWIVRRWISIADIAAFPHVALAHDCGIGLEDFPALNLWQRRIRKLPGFVGMPGIPDYF